MIYRIDDKKVKVDIDQIDQQHMYIGMMSLDELKQVYPQLHISKKSIERCEETSLMNQNMIIPHNDYYYGIMNLINSRDIFVKKDILAFYIFQNMLLVVIIDDEDQHIRNVFQSSSDYILENDKSITRLVYYFFIELISQDYEYIEELQEEIEELEAHNSEEESIVFTRQLRKLNKELLLLRNYYENLASIGEELQMNHYHLFKEDDMRYFEIYTRRIERLSNNIQLLRELVSQASEAHQSQLDYKLNKTMQLFTVVTTIFMPLTLITGWYGMNFQNMPELASKYGYYIVVGVSLVIVLLLIYWFKKKKFL